LAAPTISVCIPTFNGEPFLRECLDSVLSQTYQDFELLLVDDCSSDGTNTIAQEYCARDTRVRYFRNDHNLGLVRNWNRCIALARGEWIKFVFQDDSIAQDCLARMIDKSRNRAVLVACRRTMIFGDEITETIRRYYLDHQARVDDLLGQFDFIPPEECQKLALNNLGLNVFGEPTAVMLHRSFFDRFGAFNPDLIMSCDLEYWTRVSIHAGAFYIPENLAFFRIHSSATSAKSFALREYRTKVIDNLILLHEYVYAAIYEPLRKTAETLSPRVDLKSLFRTRCHDARRMADWARNDPRNPDRSLAIQLNEVCDAYPNIRMGNTSHVIWRLRRRFLKSLPKR